MKKPLDPAELNRDQTYAVCLALTCVRNTILEDYHCGIEPSSKTGDFSDVKVVTPYGEIPWTKVSRISNAEMKVLMQEVVDKLYTGVRYPASVTPAVLPPWRKPRLHAGMMAWLRKLMTLSKAVEG